MYPAHFSSYVNLRICYYLLHTIYIGTVKDLCSFAYKYGVDATMYNLLLNNSTLVPIKPRRYPV